MNYVRILSSMLILGIISSCYYDNREELYPVLNTDCDTINISFVESVLPILQSNCFGCHSNSTGAVSGNNIFLENYNDVKGFGENGSLFGTINHESGYSQMPKNSGKLDVCSLKKIELWIDQGYLEN